MGTYDNSAGYPLSPEDDDFPVDDCGDYWVSQGKDPDGEIPECNKCDLRNECPVLMSIKKHNEEMDDYYNDLAEELKENGTIK